MGLGGISCFWGGTGGGLLGARYIGCFFFEGFLFWKKKSRGRIENDVFFGTVYIIVLQEE